MTTGRNTVARWTITSALIAATFGCGHDAHAQVLGPTMPVATAVPTDPWQTSLALEAANDLTAARKVMFDAYGARPAAYAPCVRLAWLDLRLGNSGEAV